MNNNVRHSVGDMVVALDSTPNLFAQPREKGKIYMVKDISYCSKCGIQAINIGFYLDYSKFTDNATCTCCGTKRKCNGKHWTLSYRFAPISESTLQSAVEEENYELAAIIRDALKTETV